MPRRTKKAVKFSHSWLDRVATPKVRTEWYDRDCDCLIVRVGTSGSKVFYFFGRLAGKLERIKLGQYPRMTLAAARKEVQHMLGQAAIGQKPTTRAKAVQEETTLDQLWEWYLRTHAKPHKRTWQADESRYKRVLSRWGQRRLSTITTAMVKDLHVRLGAEQGHYAGNKMLELLGFMWRLGRAELGYVAPDPTAGLKRFPKRERERFLDREELPRFLAALAQYPTETTRDYIMVCLLTGARRSNVAAMRWDAVHLEQGLWEVAAGESKNKSSMRLILAPPVIKILTRRQKASESEWVFPGGGKTGHIVEPKHAMAAIRASAGIKDLRLHDLRRTLGSWQAALGTSLPIIGKSLGHTSVQSTRIYARLNLDPVRESVQDATAKMLETLPADPK